MQPAVAAVVAGLELERAARRVGVLDVDAQHAFEVAVVDDQQPVQTFAADGEGCQNSDGA
jgi:hypothetical protein